MAFPNDFVWGAATAAYQIEGSPAVSGGGESVWDMFCRQPGKTFNGETGGKACEHYLRYGDDVHMMRQLGLRAYRFSISWPRVIPQGVGHVDTRGIDFYDSLVDRLLEAGIDPWVTLFHWDFPYALFLQGGWLNPDSGNWFAEYAAAVVDRLGDRVRNWITLNEPQCFVRLGHLTGEHAPGLRLGEREVMQVAHHTLVAHGLAVRAIRASTRIPVKVGIAPVAVAYYPETGSEGDIDAARQRTLMARGDILWSNTWWMDPLFFGAYPEDGLRQLGANAPDIAAGDMAAIGEPIDFIGENIYVGTAVRAGDTPLGECIGSRQGDARTMYHWPVTPQAMYWATRFLHERYRLPIIITENGMANTDWVALDGRVHDAARIDFLNRHLLELERACRDGIPVQGFFHWSLMDNFEWNEGYKHRFGLIHVDFETQQRLFKDSAYWYRHVIATNGLSLHRFEVRSGLPSADEVAVSTSRPAVDISDDLVIADAVESTSARPEPVAP